MGRKYISHGCGAAAFTTGPTPETVRLLRELRDGFEYQKRSKLFPLRRWLGESMPVIREYVDPTCAFERREAELLKRGQNETECRARRIQNYIDSILPTR